MIVKKKRQYVCFSKVKWFNYKKGLYFLLNLNNKLKDKKLRCVDSKSLKHNTIRTYCTRVNQ